MNREYGRRRPQCDVALLLVIKRCSLAYQVGRNASRGGSNRLPEDMFKGEEADTRNRCSEAERSVVTNNGGWTQDEQAYDQASVRSSKEKHNQEGQTAS
ncbi:hypothetical protein PIB30_077820 [Stylosanthes scabra]|uniref:Uncharacterized protein n=1 Tax=Stylosanthes scabra TaxID=79078 RepID=A0ABU6UPI6_9FABA|nr:hypothetical protein [Stylosanthes scabra]